MEADEPAVTLTFSPEQATLLASALRWPASFLRAWIEAGQRLYFEHQLASKQAVAAFALTRVRRYRPKRCTVYGVAFHSTVQARYCSDRCRMRAFRARRARGTG